MSVIALRALATGWICAMAVAAQAACLEPTRASLWRLPVVRQALLSPDPTGLEWRHRSQARGAGHGAGHWVHLSGAGPVHGALVWVPCRAQKGRSAGVQVLDSGGFVGWSSLPAQGTVPARLLLTHRHTGTGLESHETVVLALRGDRLRVLLRVVAHESLSSSEQRDTERQLTWLRHGQLVEIRTRTQVDGRELPVSLSQQCWSAVVQRYKRCVAGRGMLRGPRSGQHG